MEDDADILREVPDSLQRLVRFTVRGFYGIEHGLAIDVLVRNACVKEEDILELLKFEKKQLRVVLNQLKNDKFLKSRPYVETQEDGKVTRHNYYFVNYRSVANVIKYKLHHMHKRIDTMERDETNRPSFRCPTCQSTYSDLEVKQLIDPMMGTLNCTFCRTEVVEDKATLTGQDSRTLQARFNEQMEPVYKLLKEVENISLADEVLDPKPSIIPHLHPSASRVSKSKEKSDENWSVGRSAMTIVQEQDVIIDLGAETREEAKKPKEAPIWMSESTVSNPFSQSTSAIVKDELPVSEPTSKTSNDEVLQVLLKQEHSSRPPAVKYPAHQGDSEEESDDFQDVDDEEEIIYVSGKPYTYEEVTRQGQQLINQMTSNEKDNYIRVGQRLYEDMDD